jgi:magnesium chelatase accessory protein
MAEALAALLQALAVAPRLAVGHSAGAAILARMSLDRQIAPDGLVSLNGAILPLGGLPGHLFSPVARLCAGSALLPRLFAWHAAQRNVVENLLRDTGSRLDPAGIEFYRRLFRRPGHVAAALGMMAAWDLRPLARDLPRLQPPLAQLIGANDRTIPPRDAARVRALVRSATLDLLPGLGHLAHEEAPMTLAPLILRHAVLWGVLPS